MLFYQAVQCSSVYIDDIHSNSICYTIVTFVGFELPEAFIKSIMFSLEMLYSKSRVIPYTTNELLNHQIHPIRHRCLLLRSPVSFEPGHPIPLTGHHQVRSQPSSARAYTGSRRAASPMAAE